MRGGEKSVSAANLRKEMHDTFFIRPVITWKLLDELMAVIAHVQIEENDLIDMYRESVYDGWPLPDFQSDNAAELLALMIRDLIQAPAANNTLPLIEFVRRIANVIAEPLVQEKLRAWCTKAAKYANIADTDTVSSKRQMPI